MLFLDAPGRTRLRTLVSKAFAPKAVDGLEPRIRGFPDRCWAASRTRPASVSCTGMESRVAVLSAEGRSVRGESTIRSHVKQLFARHGLSRPAELVRLVLALAGAPEPRR